TATDVGDVDAVLRVCGSEIARRRHGRRHERDEKRREVGPGREEARPDERAYTHHHGPALSQCEPTYGFGGDQLVTPAGGHRNGEASSKTGVRQLHGRSRRSI